MSWLSGRGRIDLLVLSVLAIALGFIADLPVLIAVGLVAGWAVLSRLLPPGGALVTLAVAILWTNAAVVATKIHGAPSYFGLLPIVMFGGVAIGRIVGHKRGVVVSPGFRAMLLYAAALSVATLFAISPSTGFGSLQVFLVEGLLLYFVVLNSIDDRATLRMATIALVSASAFIGLLSLIQFLTKSYGNDFGGFAQLSEDRAVRLAEGDVYSPKLAGPIGEQNRYAQNLVVIVPLAVALSHHWVKRPIITLLSVVPIAAGVALTTSRGAAVAFVLGLMAMTFFRLVSLRSLVMFVVAIVVLVSIVPGYQDRLVSSIAAAQGISGNEEVDGSALSRLTENLAAFNVFVDNPVRGVGPGGFGDQYERYAERVGFNVKEGTRQPHNLYLGIAAEVGLVGLTTFMLVVVLVGSRLLMLWWRARNMVPQIAALAAGYLCAIFAYLVSGVFLHLSFERFYWLLLVLADVAARVGARELRQGVAAVELSREAEAGEPWLDGRSAATP